MAEVMAFREDGEPVLYVEVHAISSTATITVGKEGELHVWVCDGVREFDVRPQDVQKLLEHAEGFRQSIGVPKDKKE